MLYIGRSGAYGMATALLMMLLMAQAYAALPPGYEEELYCPADSCLQNTRRDLRGATGPRAMMYECCDELNPAHPTRPQSWGALVGAGYRAGLLAAGYHMRECGAGSACAGVRALARGLESRVEALLFI